MLISVGTWTSVCSTHTGLRAEETQLTLLGSNCPITLKTGYGWQLPELKPGSISQQLSDLGTRASHNNNPVREL